MDTESPEWPNIQIDDLVRPMTEEEYEAWMEQQANTPELLGGE
jgi:hypothetical protein